MPVKRSQTIAMRLLKRKTRKVEGFGKLELERVIGLTTASQSGLSCNATTGELAYLAGAVVVIYNVKANSQTQFLVAPKTAKAFSCVAYSGQGGRFLAAGESGHQPGIIIWEVAVGARVAELRAHKQGVCCVQFSPNGKHLVSVGVPSDGQVCLWDWRSGTLLAKSRASTTSQPACALQFASDGSFFVTGGVKHLKHWVIGLPKARSVGGNGTTGMEGKTVNLGTQKDSSFVAILSAPPSKDASTVTPDFQPLYALTAGGILCLLHCGLAIEKWVDLKVRHGYALAISGAHVGCACSDGIVRVFMHGSLTYAVTLPRPPPYGHHGLVDASVGATIAVGNRTQPGIRFPDAVACSFLQEGQTLAVIYADHSLLVWDVQSFSKIGRYRTLLSHNACIWDVSLLPSPHQAPTLQPMNEKDCSPRGTFATCSADGSIRLWCLDSGQEKSTANLNAGAPPTAGPVNIYNKEILGVLYIDKRDDQKDKVVIGASDEEPFSSLQGFRTICASPDGQHLAAGDRNGNLRVYDLNTLQLIIFKEAHDGEVLSLSFTSNTKDTLVEEPTSIPLLASGGRDRLINIYDVNSRYDIVETLADHTALITSVKFACCGSKLLSCSADKSVIFRNVLASGGRCKFIRYHQELSPRGSFYDIDTDPFSKHAVAVGQDKKLSVLNLISGKTVRHLKLEGDVGEPFKVRLDPSGTYVVCSHSDRIMRIYDFHNGELLTQASGHAEIITGMVFLPDSRRLVSVSGDSCIFIWRLPLNMSRCMRKRCIIYSESRPPPRCLKSAPVHSSRYLDTTNSTPGGADQTILFDPLAVKSKEICTNGRKENFGEIKHIEATILSVGQDSIQEAAERPHTEAGENKKSVQCYGCDGYSALSEIRKEVEHPLTSSNVNSNYTEQLDTNIPDNTRERRSLQHEESHLLTAQVNPRKEIQWKTVHTVFFSDNDYGHDELPSKAGHLDFRTCADDLKNRAGNVSAYSNTLSISSITVDEKVSEKSSVGREIRSLQTMRNSEDEDGVLTHPLDNHKGLETHKSTVVLVKAKASDELGERNERPRTCDGIKSGLERLEVSSTGEQSFGILDGFHQETLNHSAQSKHVDRTLKQDLKKDDQCYRISTVEWPKVHIDSELVKANTDDDFLIRRDLFSEYFPNLVSKIKVDDSDESSFSARFVARSTSSNPQSSWFDTLSSPKADRKFSGTETQALLQDDELEYNPGRLLADERERLKLRERQDKMAIEVQRMRERLVNLGIAVAEIAHDGETTDNKWDSDEKYPECCHYSMPSESPNKRSELAAHTAVEHEDSCRPNSSELPGSGQCAKRALSCSLQDRIANGTENLCTGGVSKTNCSGLSTGGLYSLDASAPGNLGTPRTPKIGRTIDLWQIKARKEPEDGKVESVGEVEIYLATNPASVKQAESSVDEGSGFDTLLRFVGP
ncbi:uncharacterized protein [Physcomitrium patens]|uniref:uncharacterized protein isoform X3 n=1 Tax=Physcomitrium patens TaxID=3218 RepID=UPI003CCCA8D4